jgi:hypothetical protein
MASSSAAAMAAPMAAAPPPAPAPTPGVIQIQVALDGSVDVQEAHLSDGKKQEVHWDLVGGTGGETMTIVPDEVESKWPLHVQCTTPTHCEGKIKANPKKHDPHPYHVEVGRAGTDPVIIIDD